MVRVETYQRHMEYDTIIEVGTPESTIRVVCDNWSKVPFLPSKEIQKDFIDLYNFTRQPGKNIFMSLNVALQTIRYLKETN